MSTKRASYELTKKTAGASQRRVITVLSLAASPGLTRAEIAERTGLRLSSVCGRVKELITSGQIRPRGVKTYPDTNRTVEVLELIPLR